MAIQFESVVHQYVYDRVRRILDGLQEATGEKLYTAHEEHPTFGVQEGSASARIYVIPLGEDEAAVRVISWVVRGANTKDPELMRFLLRKNHDRNLGSFALDKDGDVVLKYTFTGTSCTQTDISNALSAVLLGADEVDDEIVARWGGETARG